MLHLNTRWVRLVTLKVGVHVVDRFGIQFHFIHWMPQLSERENATGGWGCTGEGGRDSHGAQDEREVQKNKRLAKSSKRVGVRSVTGWSLCERRLL